MRAVVTGGAGFIGSHLVDRLSGAGWDVIVIDDLSGGDNPMPAGVELRRSRVQATVPPDVPLDAIFHLASKVGPVGVLHWAGRIAKDTVDAAATASKWALRAGCPLIDVSTSEVYGDPAGPNSEATQRIFQSGASARMEYAVGKLAAETMLLNTAGLDVRIVRPFNVTGPRQLVDGGFVLPRFVRQALAGTPLTVYQPGSQRRAFTHVADTVDGILAVYQHGRPGEAYNLGRPENACTIRDLAEEVIAAAGSGSHIAVVDPRDLHGIGFREAADKIPDASKAMSLLGWSPTWDRASIVADVIRYWRQRAAA